MEKQSPTRGAKIDICQTPAMLKKEDACPHCVLLSASLANSCHKSKICCRLAFRCVLCWTAAPGRLLHSVIELDDGKIYRKALYLMVKTMVSCKFTLKPIQWLSENWVPQNIEISWGCGSPSLSQTENGTKKKQWFSIISLRGIPVQEKPTLPIFP